MYAKLIHPTQILAADEGILRANGRITVHPTVEDFEKNGYYEVVGLDTVPEEGTYRYTLENNKIYPKRFRGVI